MKINDVIFKVLFVLLVPLYLAACSTVDSRAQPSITIVGSGKAPLLQECVVFLHGLARTYRSMNKISTHFNREGYRTLNIDYPSTKLSIEELVSSVIQPKIEQQCPPQTYRLHFVGHSMGAILSRAYIAWQRPPKLGRVVMFAPPNKGSELPKMFGNWLLFYWMFGPAGKQLSSSPDSMPNRLPTADYEVMIIAGTRSTNPIYSSIIPGRDDGKVSIERAKLDGAKVFLTVPYSHTSLMSKPDVIHQSLNFIKTGNKL